MKKNDLGVFMVVELATHERLVVAINSISGINFSILLDEYDHDLRHETDKALDIIAVLRPESGSLSDMLVTDNYLWKREPPVDWAVDTKILVWDNDSRGAKKTRKHFSHFKNGMYFAFDSGKTSFTGSSDDAIPWRYAEIYKEGADV